MSWNFTAPLEIICINPFVFVPEEILKELFKQAGRDNGHIPILVTVDNKKHQQTLVRFSGEWRLYINTTMLKDSPRRVGELLDIGIEYDESDRTIPPHPELQKALKQNPEANKAFDNLPPSRQKEITRYISSLKSTEAVDRNIQRTIGFLTGKNRFLGRESEQ